MTQKQVLYFKDNFQACVYFQFVIIILILIATVIQTTTVIVRITMMAQKKYDSFFGSE